MQEDRPVTPHRDVPDPPPAQQSQRRTLTPLGQAMERRRLVAGMGIAPFCAEHGIDRSTYYRLAFQTATQPQDTTVAHVAAAIGLNLNTALRLAGHSTLSTDGRPGEALSPQAAGSPQPDDPPARTPTPLGVQMERARQATGEAVQPYCRRRGVDRRTYYRVVYETPEPRASTVLTLARALGLDPVSALRAAGHDPHLTSELLSPADRAAGDTGGAARG
jgi:DNA-binding phage protein